MGMLASLSIQSELKYIIVEIGELVSIYGLAPVFRRCLKQRHS